MVINKDKTWIYYDSQLSTPLGKFGDRDSALKLPCCQGQLTSFPRVTFQVLPSFTGHQFDLTVTLCRFWLASSLMTSRPLETKQVALDNMGTQTLKRNVAKLPKWYYSKENGSSLDNSPTPPYHISCPVPVKD